MIKTNSITANLIFNRYLTQSRGCVVKEPQGKTHLIHQGRLKKFFKFTENKSLLLTKPFVLTGSWLGLATNENVLFCSTTKDVHNQQRDASLG